MILQALVNYYEYLVKQGKAPKLGWVKEKIYYAVEITEAGDIIGIYTLAREEREGKKSVLIPQIMLVPEAATRTSGKTPRFLWDKCEYLLNIGKDGKEDDTKKCFETETKFVLQILKHANSIPAKAIKAFYSNLMGRSVDERVLLEPYMQELLKERTIVFKIQDYGYALDDNDIIEAWNNYYGYRNHESEGICTVTGKKDNLARIHPKIKGVYGAQSAGAALVAFNERAFESYGHVQGMNANIGEYAAFAYTTALNFLLSNNKNHCRLGDVTVIYWSENNDEISTDFFAELMSDEINITDDDLNLLFKNIEKGLPVKVNNITLNTQSKFYILGLSPNNARLTVRFFFANSFGFILKNIIKFFKDFKIVRHKKDLKENLSVWQILQETANKKSKEKKVSASITAALMRSALNGEQYPAALFHSILLRVKADQDDSDKHIYKISRTKAAIIKAFLLRNIKGKEDVSVSLDVKRENEAYVLGRLFAVLERLQKEAYRNDSGKVTIDSTIKDKYFNSASTTPVMIFPVLLRLADKHRKKISDKKGLAVYFEKSIADLLGRISKIPSRLSLIDQSEFILGYYHQVNYKEDK